jgi:hypothetical protein
VHQAHSDGDSATESGTFIRDLKTAALILRLLRNLCVNSTLNQNAIRVAQRHQEPGSLLFDSVQTLTLTLIKSGTHLELVANNYCGIWQEVCEAALQFLINFATGNTENQCFLWDTARLQRLDDIPLFSMQSGAYIKSNSTQSHSDGASLLWTNLSDFLL